MSRPGNAGTVLREWRVRRRFSQMDLALHADVSTKHLSYVETGRARPSPDANARRRNRAERRVGARHERRSGARHQGRRRSANYAHDRMCQREAVGSDVEFRRLGRVDVARVAEIDRTERIDVLIDQRGVELVARRGEWSATAWDPDGHGEHSVAAQVHALAHYLDTGGIALGAFAKGRLVGIGVVVPHLRRETAQLAFLHVSAPFRATGVGSNLCDHLEQVARTAGDTVMVVSATPSQHTVRFYLGRGFRPMAEPLAELFEREPEDVHMHKAL